MSNSEHRTETVRSGDVDLFYRAFGDTGATPVLITHGLSFMSYDWIEVAGGLAATREVMAMDLRGFGESSWSVGKKYTVNDYAQDSLNLLDHRGWDQAVLIGHSFGGRIATWCAAENPDRVKALVLVDYSPDIAPAGGKRVATVLANEPERFGSVDEALEYFGADGANAKVRARYEAFLKEVDGGYIVKRDTIHGDRFRNILAGNPPPPGPDLWDALARVACPILVVRGTRSTMFAPETVEKAKSTNANLTLVEVDAGHNVGVEAPDALLREVDGFLKEMKV